MERPAERLLKANPKNLIRFVPAEGLDGTFQRPIPNFRIYEEARMRKAIIPFLTAAAAITIAFSASAEDKVLTVYTYESFTSEWGPGA